MGIKRNADGKTASVTRSPAGTGGRVGNKNPYAVPMPASKRDVATGGAAKKKAVPRKRGGK